MHQKMLPAMFVFVVSSQVCWAQDFSRPASAVDFSRPAIVTSNWDNDPALSFSPPRSIGGLTMSPPNYSFLDINWQIAELASELYDVSPGTPLDVAIQRIKILEGTEDGGLQLIPATRFYFDADIIVNIPAKDGRVVGPLRFSPGVQSVD